MTRRRLRLGSSLIIPTRLRHLVPQLRNTLLLDEIRSLLALYNRRTGKRLTLVEQPLWGWCMDCQAFVEAGQTCGCRK